MNWKKIIGFWILGMALMVGVLWLGREFYYYKHPVIAYFIGIGGNPAAEKYSETCGFIYEKTSRFGMDKPIVEMMKRANDTILELMLRMQEKYPSREKSNLRMEFSFENNVTKISYQGTITDAEGTEFQVDESVQFDGILTETVYHGKSAGDKYEGIIFKGIIAACGVLWFGALFLIFRKKR